MRVLVTGATGFLGGHLVDALRAGGHEIVVWARSTSDTRRLESLDGVTIRRGDIADVESLADAMRGTEAVIHAAGGGKVLRIADVYRDNRGSAEAVLRAATLARSQGPRRLVLVSSLAAAGGSHSGRPRKEEDPAEPASHYGRSKLAAERLWLEARAEKEIAIVRPPAVYGPGDTRMLGLFRAARHGLLPMVAPRGSLSLVYARDCADAIVRSAEAELESGRVFFVADGPPYARREFAARIGDAVGRRARVLPIPGSLVQVAGAMNELVGSMRGESVILSRDKAADIRVPHQTCDASRAQRELGWEPTLRFDEGARLTAEAYRAAGWL